MAKILEALFAHTADAYRLNSRLIVFFSIPFLIALPVASFLPTFVSGGGISLRFSSIPGDLDAFKLALIAVAFLVSLFLASFALAAINIVVRSQRTLNKLTHYEIERIEHATFRLFSLLVLAALVILAVNLLLLDAYANVGSRLFPLQPLVGSLVALVVSLAIIFAPQAIAIDDAPLSKTVLLSTGLIRRRFSLFLFYILFGSAILLLNDAFFLAYASESARLFTLVANALVWVPFLEVFKTQIYLSKYHLI